MAREKSAGESEELISVVVLKGKHLRHEGNSYTQNSRVRLSANDAERLSALGFVKALTDLKQELEFASPEVVSVTQTESQTTITTAPAKKSSSEGDGAS